MKTIVIIFGLFLACFFLSNCSEKVPAEQPETNATPQAVQLSQEEQIKRGAYLVEAIGCYDCHSPKIMTAEGPVPDPKRHLSGHPADEKLAALTDQSVLQNYALFNMSLTAAIGPWGTSFAANLTPDETGLGNWTFEQFEKVLKEGKFKGMDNGRMILPPMPWQSYRHLSKEDMQAIWAYLQSIPPVKNVVPAAIPPAG